MRLGVVVCAKGNKALRLACVGEAEYGRALATYRTELAALPYLRRLGRTMKTWQRHCWVAGTTPMKSMEAGRMHLTRLHVQAAVSLSSTDFSPRSTMYNMHVTRWRIRH